MYPLLERDLDSVIAVLQGPLRPLKHLKQITTAHFLGQALALAEALPPGRYALNLCGNRYLFLLAFCAVLLKRQTNLLPPNRNLATQAALLEKYEQCYLIHDQGVNPDGADETFALVENHPLFNFADIDLSVVAPEHHIPTVDADALCAIVFTSGSTGESKPNFKYWRTFRESSFINVNYMVPPCSATWSVLATVPGQHMWGLETSVLNALFADLAVNDSRLLFPKDIQNALSLLPEPRMLVTTPVHLRALLNSGLEFPAVARILCATAPLSEEVATRAEKVFGGDLLEVFGCSEVGSMACRRTSQQESWQLFNGIHLERNTLGTLASADHLPTVVQMQDVMELQDQNRFTLCGRHSDMVDIAGKRGSLQEINQVLLSVPGVVDGVVFMTDADTRAVPRLIAFVVGQADLDKNKITQFFRQKLDAAFVPRPIIFLESLPREENGKLTQNNVLALYDRIKALQKSG